MPNYTIKIGDNRQTLKELPDNSVDSVVCDPPYELAFMGKSWDSTGIAYDVTMWSECLRVLKPGGHLIAFSGSRTYHRMAVAIEDAGFQIRDQIMWVYGSGFPKSHNISKAIESTLLNGSSHSTALRKTEQDGDGKSYKLTGRNNGIMGEHRVFDRKEFTASTEQAQQWEGWGTALKPAHEPIVLARKPLDGTVAINVLKWGVGGLNIDATRVCVECGNDDANEYLDKCLDCTEEETQQGRFPANFIHDGSQEVLELFPDVKGSNNGSAARFFYCPKANKKDRNEGLDGFEEKQMDDSRKEGNVGGDNPRNRGVNKSANHHPTVKPTELMAYLCRLVTPPNGIVLDPFMGSGSTGKACMREGFNFIGCELSEEYVKIAEARIQSELKNFTTSTK